MNFVADFFLSCNWMLLRFTSDSTITTRLLSSNFTFLVSSWFLCSSKPNMHMVFYYWNQIEDMFSFMECTLVVFSLIPVSFFLTVCLLSDILKKCELGRGC
jgi:hypothetical protein